MQFAQQRGVGLPAGEGKEFRRGRAENEGNKNSRQSDYGVRAMANTAELVKEREQLDAIADTEGKLLTSLRDALQRFDQRLLKDVRNVTAEHESRRGLILHELQSLASRIGVFPASPDPRLGGSADVQTSLHPHGTLRAIKDDAGWASTDQLQRELNDYFKKRA